MTAASAVAVADQIRANLEAVATPERAAAEKRYLKSDLDFLGATMPEIARVTSTAARSHPDLTHSALVSLVEELWGRGIHELRVAAVDLLKLFPTLLGPADLLMVQRLIRDAKTWALVDTLATDVLGGLVERHPELGEALDEWVVDDDFWVRRAALLAHLRPLRRGAGDFERFTRYADAMLEEKEFFIRKAIGWVLRDTARKRPDMVYRWIAPRTHRASGVTMREVVKPLTPQQRDELMAAYRERLPVSPHPLRGEVARAQPETEGERLPVSPHPLRGEVARAQPETEGARHTGR